MIETVTFISYSVCVFVAINKNNSCNFADVIFAPKMQILVNDVKLYLKIFPSSFICNFLCKIKIDPHEQLRLVRVTLFHFLKVAPHLG